MPGVRLTGKPSKAVELYQQRKLDGNCTRCGQPATEDSRFCEQHHADELRYQKKAKKRLRRSRRKAGLCAFCPRKSKTYRCAKCRIQSIGLKSGVRIGVQNWEAKLERIRARTATGDDGRVRYHGQTRRGRQSVGSLDEQDIDAVIHECGKALEGLRLARDAKHAELPRIQRKEAEHAALGFLYLATRLADEVLDRNRFERPAAVDEDEDE